MCQQWQVYDPSQDGAFESEERKGVSVHRTDPRSVLYALSRAQAGKQPNGHGMRQDVFQM